MTALTPAAGLSRADALTEALVGSTTPTEEALGTNSTGSTPPGSNPDRAIPTGKIRTATIPSRPIPAGSTAAAVSAARARLEHGLSDVVAEARTDPEVPADQAPREPLARIGHYQVAQALEGLVSPTRPAARASSFRWTARAARRSIGLAAVRAGLDGRAATPADAVAVVMAEPDGPFGVGRTGPGSCADWIVSLAPPARTLVVAEATVWTTRLWTGVDWGSLARRHIVVGGPDRWWRWSDPSATYRVAVRGRADVRVSGEPGVDDRLRGAHLLVLDGQPELVSRRALLLSALVDALSSRRDRVPAPVPARVIGWWPDCGKSWIVPVDAGTLLAAADAVVSTVRGLIGKGAQGGRTCRQ